MDMFASTAGPPRKPVLAATNNNPAVNTMATGNMKVVHAMPPIVQVSSIEWNTTAFKVSPSTGFTSHNMYSIKIPPAVKASDVAI